MPILITDYNSWFNILDIISYLNCTDKINSSNETYNKIKSVE